MQEVNFTLQTITPLFLAGANQQEFEIDKEDQRPGEATLARGVVAEIRPPSFRGLMRYWLRTAVAGLASTQPVGLEDVRDFEKYIFGATDQGSAVQARIKNIPEDIEKDAEKFEKEPSSREQVSGRDYLYWSMAKSGKGNKHKPARRYLPRDTTFSVTLSAHGEEDTHARKLECAIAAFWLFTSLGGIGSRSRRCAGSLAVTNVSGNTTKLSFAEARDAQELQRILRQGIQEVRRMYTSQLATVKEAMGNTLYAPLQNATFDMLSLPKFCRIWILQRDNATPWTNPKDALSDIGKALQSYRRGIWPLEDRTAFGLPLIVQRMPESDLKAALQDNRRASPLLLKIHKLQGEKYVGIAVLFKTQFQKIADLPVPNYRLIEEWIQKKFSRTAALEVTL